jgi:chromate transporter
MPILAQLAMRIAGLALIAVGGGNALIPALHDQAVVTTHWLSDARFTEAVGLTQAAPGPNMLLIPLIGWETAGSAGAAVALVAFLVPSSTLAIVGSRLLVRYDGTAAVKAFKWVLRPVAAGLMASSAIVLVRTAAQTLPHPSALSALAFAALACGVTIAALRFKVNPLVWLAVAAVLGALA